MPKKGAPPPPVTLSKADAAREARLLELEQQGACPPVGRRPHPSIPCVAPHPCPPPPPVDDFVQSLHASLASRVAAMQAALDSALALPRSALEMTMGELMSSYGGDVRRAHQGTVKKRCVGSCQVAKVIEC